MIIRARFHANPDDYRPIKWPIKYPFWCSGHGEDYSIVIAYVDKIEDIYELWPEASNIDAEEREEITFSDRFPKPDWYQST